MSQTTATQTDTGMNSPPTGLATKMVQSTMYDSDGSANQNTGIIGGPTTTKACIAG